MSLTGKGSAHPQVSQPQVVAVQHPKTSKLVILSPTLLTEETGDLLDDDHQVADDRGSCKAPHQTATRL